MNTFGLNQLVVITSKRIFQNAANHISISYTAVI